MVAASSTVNRESNTIHGITEVDVSEARRRLRMHKERTGEGLSFTGWVVACLARTVAEFPEMNSFRRGGKHFLLDEVTVSVLVERWLAGEPVPEPLAVRSAQTKSHRQIHEEIRAAQQREPDRLGSLEGMSWVRFLPPFLLRSFVRIAARLPSMALRYGRVAVTAVGMFGTGALWFIPLSSATVAVTVGSIVPRPVEVEGRIETREHLCLTLSFDHDIVDGAPAARFVRRLAERMQKAELLPEPGEG
jgi:pyruvate/2-oxoglutarate dehydrogenase complex dihydrolipoamide acyltransferase (E2) component